MISTRDLFKGLNSSRCARIARNLNVRQVRNSKKNRSLLSEAALAAVPNNLKKADEKFVPETAVLLRRSFWLLAEGRVESEVALLPSELARVTAYPAR